MIMKKLAIILIMAATLFATGCKKLPEFTSSNGSSSSGSDTPTTITPEVVTLEATAITENSAVLNGVISNYDGNHQYEGGFYWGTTAELDFVQPADGISQGTFSALLTGLTSNTTYYYKACAFIGESEENAGFGEVKSFTTNGGQSGSIQSLPYTQDFSTSFNTYTTYNVLGEQKWTIEFQTAKMSGYSLQSNYDNEDWLISSPIHITGVEHAKAIVNYVAQYSAPNEDDITMWVSADYELGSHPNTASWTKLSGIYPNTEDFSDFQNQETSLDSFIGQIITIAIKYTSTTTDARTIEIKHITIQEGAVNGNQVYFSKGNLQYQASTNTFLSD